MMRRTSSSISRAVSPEIAFVFAPADMPRNTSASSSSYINGPSFSDRPHLVTMLRASRVARSMSLDAPVVTPSGPSIISSAIRPPKNEQIFDRIELPAVAVAVFFRQEHRHAQRTTARNDRHLVDRVVLGHDATDDRVAGFVIRGRALLLLGHDHRFALGAHHDLVFGLVELVHFDETLARRARQTAPPRSPGWPGRHRKTRAYHAR